MNDVVVENPLNNSMKMDKFNTGVIPTPGMHYKPVLFSDYECTKQFHQMERDIYESKEKKQEFGKNLKTPKSLFIILAAPCVLYGGAKLVKIIKNIFKKH